MGRMRYKILCPAHDESTPSCAVYEDGSGFCFGCNTRFDKLDDPQPPTQVEPENLDEKIRYIESLPKVTHRRLSFHADSRGYYLVWPAKDYYKVRAWETSVGDGPKYVGAAGHRKPYFSYPSEGKVAAIIEGEINAMSLHEAYPDLPIYCPGGAGNFTDSTTTKMLPLLKKYDQIHIIVDEDMAGVNAAIKLKGLLQPDCKNVVIQLMEEDVNSILVTKGVQAIKETLGLTNGV